LASGRGQVVGGVGTPQASLGVGEGDGRPCPITKCCRLRAYGAPAQPAWSARDTGSVAWSPLDIVRSDQAGGRFGNPDTFSDMPTESVRRLKPESGCSWRY
jgi:hypothetical protein